MADEFSSLTRRQFGITLAAATAAASIPAAESGEAGPWSAPAIVKKVYIGVANPTWPRPDLDIKKEIAGIDARLAQLERKHAGLVRFTGGEWLKDTAEVEAWIKDLSGADAVLVLDLTSSTGALLQPFDKLDVPKLLFTRPITGWSFIDGARWIQLGLKGDMVASSRFEDLAPHLPLLRAIHHLRNSKILVITTNEKRAAATAAGYTTQFGTQFAFPSYQELKAAYEAIDPKQAEQEAADLRRKALTVMEPSAADLRDASRFYLAVVAFLRQYQANAITIDCLGGFRRGDLPAYPCVAWSKLNDRGMYGVCEADLQSTMTQLLVTGYSGKPGFVSDPTFDVSTNDVIHAHCVSATRLHGKDAPASPYILRSHMEDNKGVSMQVKMPEAETITCGKFREPKTFLVSTGRVTANVDSARGCRTKIVTRVSDARKMVEGYTGGLHRVIFYGDHVEPIERLGRLTGFKVIREV
jgi:hypothetical protein